MQIKITSTNAIMELQDFFAANPNISFPEPLTNAALSGFGATLYTPPPDIPALKAAALLEIDKQCQALYSQAIANPAIKDEYNAAYQAATAWLLNQTGPVPVRVAALAAKFGVPNVMAATIVKTKTEEGNAKLDARGAARLNGKTAIEAATTPAAINAALVAGVAAMQAISFTV